MTGISWLASVLTSLGYLPFPRHGRLKVHPPERHLAAVLMIQRYVLYINPLKPCVSGVMPNGTEPAPIARSGTRVHHRSAGHYQTYQNSYYLHPGGFSFRTRMSLKPTCVLLP
jgi:hypothetical protein